MKKAIRFGRLFLFSPSEAAEACAKDGALRLGLMIYAAFAVAQLWSAWMNPLSFLDPNAPAAVAYGGWFWTRVALWEPVLFALSILLVAVVLEWLREGSMPVKLASTAGWAAVPVAMLAYYASEKAAPRLVYVAILLVWCAPAALIARRVPRARARGVASFMLGLCAFQLASLAAVHLTVVPMRSMRGFIALSLVSVIWLLGIVGFGLRRVVGMSTARTVLGFFIAMLLASVVPALAYVLGLMPMEVLKVMIYV